MFIRVSNFINCSSNKLFLKRFKEIFKTWLSMLLLPVWMKKIKMKFRNNQSSIIKIFLIELLITPFRRIFLSFLSTSEIFCKNWKWSWISPTDLYSKLLSLPLRMMLFLKVLLPTKFWKKNSFIDFHNFFDLVLKFSKWQTF